MIVQPQTLIEFFGLVRIYLKVHNDVIAFVLFFNLVSKTFPAPLLNAVDAAAMLRHQLLNLRDDALGIFCRQIRIDNKHAFVIPHYFTPIIK